MIAGIPLHPSMGESVNFMFTGFIVVIAVLFAMYIFMKLLGVFFAGNSAKAAAAKKLAVVRPAASQVAAPVAAAPSAANSHLVAVIAAAAHVVLGSRVRIVSVHTASSEWGAEGRRQIFASKQVR
ncbi:MAG: OadG family protein [Opitutales bacterium]|nr:OadG family protein [Opitutales bacterium]